MASTKIICVIALLVAHICANITAPANFIAGFQGPHGVYAWNESITGNLVEQQFQLQPGTKICAKVYYQKGGDVANADPAYCYVNATNAMVCYDDDSECAKASTWGTGADSDADSRLSLSVLTVTGKVCSKNYWRKTSDETVQSLYCYTNAANALQCYDDTKECLKANNGNRRLLEKILLEPVTVDNQVCTRNYYMLNEKLQDAYCWSAFNGQQCWTTTERCLSDVELQVKPVSRKTVDNYGLSTITDMAKNLIGGYGKANGNGNGNGVPQSVTPENNGTNFSGLVGNFVSSSLLGRPSTGESGSGTNFSGLAANSESSSLLGRPSTGESGSGLVNQVKEAAKKKVISSLSPFDLKKKLALRKKLTSALIALENIDN